MPPTPPALSTPPSRPRYLTKSRFTLALGCPTKLFYTGKKDYPDRRTDNSFLMALAEGGFQVGELAKLYYPGGIEIETLDHEQALAQTGELLQRPEVTLFEAAVRWENLFIRIDILVKNGSTFELVEVKSKSFGGGGPEAFLTKGGSIDSNWIPYLYDVAFQKYVLSRAFPQLRIRSWLMLADKRAVATVDGLNQCFLIVRDEQGRSRVRVREGTTFDSLGQPLLTRVPVDKIAETIYRGEDGSGRTESFADGVGSLSTHYKQDIRIDTALGAKCSSCEFKCTPKEEQQGLKSGFQECWHRQTGLKDAELDQPLVINLWNSRKKDSFLQRELYRLRDLDEELVQPKSDGKPGLSTSQRQWLQVEMTRTGSAEPYCDIEGLRVEMQNWVYPLHFIDFETTAVAIPFSQGRAPYEGIAFQFSHHRVLENGGIEHAGQYLHRERGQFPSFDFLRALKQDLETDQGTIFRYAPHENTYLNIIYSQLLDAGSDEAPDRDELLQWITTIATPTERNKDRWQAGPRKMIDLLELVKRYYFHPQTGGSNSLKQVIPAVLASSPHLREKYSRPIYGKGCEIESLNFEDWVWIRYDDEGRMIDPYRLLPPIFADTSNDELETLISDSALADGGAAMVAYARMQFSEMNEIERRAIEQALLKYCELDTLAMVMLWEYWNNESNR